MMLKSPIPVTLNLFQGPSLGLRRSVVRGVNRAVEVSTQAPGRAAQWVLKQVQHDELREGRA